MPSVLIGPVLMIAAGFALFLSYCGWMCLHRNTPMPRAAHVGTVARATYTATVIPPSRAPAPVQRLAVSFWDDPKPLKGEIER